MIFGIPDKTRLFRYLLVKKLNHKKFKLSVVHIKEKVKG